MPDLLIDYKGFPIEQNRAACGCKSPVLAIA
ncbi:hypothetical protein PSCFBP3800_00116 [Pseudomonas syringae group genomosp. 3]|nr:hypothetical protein PSCFBP3800_00116 [Pseudomonas syringae group genomosp. 3]